MFTVKQLQYKIVYKNFQCRNVQEMKRSIVKHCTPRSQIMWNVTLNSSYTSSYIINVDQNKNVNKARACAEGTVTYLSDFMYEIFTCFKCSNIKFYALKLSESGEVYVIPLTRD